MLPAKLPIRFSDINREYIGILSLVYGNHFPFEIFRGAICHLKTNGMQRHPQFNPISKPLPGSFSQMILIALHGSHLIVLIKASSLVSLPSGRCLNGLNTATTSYTFPESYIAAAVIYCAVDYRNKYRNYLNATTLEI